MKCATLLILLLSVTSSCFGSPLSEWEKTRLWVYDYHGNIDTRSSADNETLSRWTVSGKLSVYNSLKNVVIKFNDVKTSLFNGERKYLHDIKEKDIPQEAKSLLQPFYIKKDDDDLYIYFEPNEPLWSKNFKRGIASNLNININKVNPSIKNQILNEKSIHGYCEVSYNVEETKDKQVYEKIINHENCVQKPITLSSNIKGKVPAPKDFKSFKAKTVKTATFLPDENGVFIPNNIISTSNIRIKISPNIPNTQNVDQMQKFDLVYKEIVKEIPFDVSNITKESDLIFEYSLVHKYDYTLGRHIDNQDQQSLVQEYINEFKSFEEYFFTPYLKHVDISKQQDLGYILYKMTDEGLKLLEEELHKMNDNYNILATYYSLLPYIGTEGFVKYFAKYIQSDNWSLNEYVISNIMSTFPRFLADPNEETLKQLEVLMNLENAILQSTKNNGILSFAQVVSQVYEKDSTITKDKIMKYVDLYHDQFLTNQNLESRMTYLLGLINMANILDIDVINNIITNISESKHLRILAITGFKEKLIENSSKLYKIYWSIVQNNQEPFEVKIKALDLLLSIKLTDEQFNTIIKKYSVHSNDPQEKQLANYLLTSLHSIQNTTRFYDYLGAQAFEAIQNNHIPSFPKSFATGNYRVSHTDDDLGSYLQAQVITDPETNMINFAQLTCNSYGFSFNLGSYSLYFNFNGLLDTVYTQFLAKLSHESVPELLASIKKYNYEILPPNENINIDIVVFENNVAIYAVHFGKFQKKSLEIFAEDLEQFFGLQLRIRYPLIDYKLIPSDLGTSLQISHVEEDISYHKAENNNAEYRLIWNYQFWIEAYNPLLDTNIMSYKYNGENNVINVNYTQIERTLSWINTNNSMAMVWDNFVGTAVENEDLLRQYCEKCEIYKDFSFDYKLVNTKNFEILGVIQKITKEVSSIENYSIVDPFAKFLADVKYQRNTDATPYAIPFAILSHYINYKRIISDELSRGSYKFLPLFEEGTESSVTLNFKGDLKTIHNPLQEKKMSLSLQVNHKPIDSDNNSILWYADYDMHLNPNYKTEEGNKKIASNQKIRISYIQNAETSKMKNICITSELLFPYLQANKYSLEPLEPTVGKATSSINDNPDEDVCDSTITVATIDVVYESYNKNEILKSKHNKRDHEDCLSQSKDLKYVAPSSPCKRISSQIIEYNHYIASGEQTVFENGEKVTKDLGKPLMEYFRQGDYLKYALRKHPSVNEFYNMSFYYPNGFVNPNKISFADFDYAFPMLATTTCTLTATTIEQFSGINVPNPNEKWLAFAECRNGLTKGLEGFKIGKNNVGFTFYSNEIKITVDIKDNKINVVSTGEHSDIKVYHIDDNALLIADKDYIIFYNTEYIEVKTNSHHTKLLCGLCINK